MDAHIAKSNPTFTSTQVKARAEALNSHRGSNGRNLFRAQRAAQDRQDCLLALPRESLKVRMKPAISVW